MRFFLTAASLSLGLVGTLPAQEAPDYWFDRLDKRADSSLEVGLNMAIRSKSQSMDADGRLQILDPQHFRLNLTFRAALPEGHESGQKELEVHLLTVADGETIWIESRNAAIEMHRVMYLPLASMNEVEAGIFYMGYGPHDELHPLKAIASLRQLGDFQVQSSGVNQVRLIGRLNEDGVARCGLPGPDFPKLDQVTIELDSKTGLPQAFLLRHDQGTAVHTRFKDFSFPEKFPKELFQYEVPEGLEPVDMSFFLGKRNKAESKEEPEKAEKESAEDQGT
ncbi:MAG: hypothetical protein DWQ01_02270 [Planctomycetota bacterium]|nr:MAG: hypothetical protein DWQ01_02270 [Planctomycetota bacterium]